MSTKIMPRVHSSAKPLRRPQATTARTVQPKFDLINTKGTLSDVFSLGFATIAKKIGQLLK